MKLYHVTAATDNQQRTCTENVTSWVVVNILYLDSPYKTVAEKEEQKKENLTKLNYVII